MKKRRLGMAVGIVMTAVLLGGCAGGTKNENAAGDQTGLTGENITEETAIAETATEGTATEESIAGEEGTDNGEYPGTADSKGMQVLPDSDMECTMGNDMACDDNLYGYDPGYYDPWYGYDPNPGNTEEYAQIIENEFIQAKEQPLSTFSADVDTASYSNIRRMLLDGYELSWIPKDSVRIEEMLNYFHYDYQGPEEGEPFGVNTQISVCPWNTENYVLMVGLQTEAVDFSEAAPSNLVFLIDVSGSMYDENKLPLLQQSFAMLAQNLTAKDRVSIVTYAGEDRVVLRGVQGNDTETILNALGSLEASGSTNGSAGIETAYELAEEYFIPGGNNRVILATDGDLNVGLTTEEELERLITKKKDSGVYLSVLGFGMGNIKDNKMELLADKGNGNYAYIDSLNEARKVLVEEMGATLATVAKDVKLQMEFSPDAVESYRLIGYENRALETEDFKDDTKDAGEIGAGHSVTVLYEIVPNRNGGKSRTTWSTLHIRYKEPDEEKSRQLDYRIGAGQLTGKPSEDLTFACCVAEFGMLLRDSGYCGTASYSGILETLSELSCVKTDSYKAEFCDLVEQAMYRESAVVWPCTGDQW